MVELWVNVDHVATLRQARGGTEPDPILAALQAEIAGAKGIVCHLREDRRHIQDRDVRLLRQVLQTRLNLEMAATSEMINFATEIRPDVVTLVPERRQERTTESGLDVAADPGYFSEVVQMLQDVNIRVSLFIDPVPEQIEAAAETGADMVELHTGPYADAPSIEQQQEELHRLHESAAYAASLLLDVAAGHGLNYDNVSALIRTIPQVHEVSIGHSIVSRAVFVGFPKAVQEMLDIIRDAALHRHFAFRNSE